MRAYACCQILCITVALITTGQGCGRAEPKVSQNPHEPSRASGGIDTSVVTAWEKAGFKLGKVASEIDLAEPAKILGFCDSVSVQSGELPALKVSWWPERGIRGLTPPNVGFGLDCSSSGVRDADLLDIADLKQLQWVNLSNNEILRP